MAMGRSIFALVASVAILAVVFLAPLPKRIHSVMTVSTTMVTELLTGMEIMTYSAPIQSA